MQKIVFLLFISFFHCYSLFCCEDFSEIQAMKKIMDINEQVGRDLPANYLILNTNIVSGISANVILHMDNEPSKDFFVLYDSLTGVPIAFYIDNCYYIYDITSGKIAKVENTYFLIKVLQPLNQNRLTITIGANSIIKKNEFQVDFSASFDASFKYSYGIQKEFYILKQNKKFNSSFIFKDKKLICFRENITDFVGLHLYVIDKNDFIKIEMEKIRKLIEELNKTNNIFKTKFLQTKEFWQPELKLALYANSFQSNFASEEYMINSLKQYEKFEKNESDMSLALKIVNKLADYKLNINLFYAKNNYNSIKETWAIINYANSIYPE